MRTVDPEHFRFYLAYGFAVKFVDRVVEIVDGERGMVNRELVDRAHMDTYENPVFRKLK